LTTITPLHSRKYINSQVEGEERGFDDVCHGVANTQYKAVLGSPPTDPNTTHTQEKERKII
jgi:hypothetical protein